MFHLHYIIWNWCCYPHIRNEKTEPLEGQARLPKFISSKGPELRRKLKFVWSQTLCSLYHSTSLLKRPLDSICNSVFAFWEQPFSYSWACHAPVSMKACCSACCSSKIGQGRYQKSRLWYSLRYAHLLHPLPCSLISLFFLWLSISFYLYFGLAVTILLTPNLKHMPSSGIKQLNLIRSWKGQVHYWHHFSESHGAYTAGCNALEHSVRVQNQEVTLCARELGSSEVTLS